MNKPITSSEQRRCRTCGALLSDSRLEGLCPACTWSSLSDVDPEEVDTPGDLPRGLFHVPDHIVIEEVARGGMGIVYRARQVEPRREVALKVLLPHQLGSAEMRERFRLEAHAIAALEHPAILPVYQVGEHDGMPYFTMKLASGGTLAGRKKSLHGNWRAIAELVATLADAIQFAHERGVLHRDLKPGNVLFDEAARVYVSDFGLAKLVSGDSDLTRSMGVLGTPQYMSPEVAGAGVQRATIASDIYSLGAILYELLSGKPPFEAESLAALLKKITETESVPASRLMPGIPHDLDVICQHCLQKEPSNRYATAAALSDDLKLWLAGRPIKARPVASAERIWRWARRNPALATVSLLLFLALIAGVVLQTQTNRRLRHALNDARSTLQESLLAQARLERSSEGRGQRFTALDLITRARALDAAGSGSGAPGSPGGSTGISQSQAARLFALRSEAAGALALPDLRTISSWPVDVGHFEGSIEFSDDMTRYVANSPNGGFVVRDSGTHRIVFSAPGKQENPAIFYRINHEGNAVAAIFQDGHGEVRSLDGKFETRIFSGHVMLRTCIQFLPDGRKVLVAGLNHGVFQFDLIDQARREFVSPPASTAALSVDPGGKYFATHGPNDYYRIFRMADGSNIWTRAKKGGVSFADWSADGQKLAFASGDPPYEITVLDLRHGKVLETFRDYEVSVGRVAFHPDGESVAASGWDGRLVWRGLGGDGFKLTAEAGPRVLHFSPAGDRLGFEPSHGQAGVFEVAQSSVFRNWKEASGPAGEVYMMAASPDGKFLATVSGNGIRLWDPAAREELSFIPVSDRVWFVQLLFRPDSRSLIYSAIGIGINEVEIKRNTPGTAGHAWAEFGQTRKLAANDDYMALEFAPDGRSLVVAVSNQSAKNERRSPDIWLWADGDEKKARKLAGDWPTVGYHMTRDRKWGLTSHFIDPDITVWDAETGRRLQGLGFKGPVNFTLTPDSRWLLASSRDEYQLVEIGSWKRGSRWSAPLGPQHYRNWVFSPDSRLVASTASDGRIDLRNIPDGTEIIQLPPPKATQVKAMSFSVDGSRLFLLTAAGRVQEWNLKQLRAGLAVLNLDWPDVTPSKQEQPKKY